MDGLRSLKNVVVIEDAAQSIGADYVSKTSSAMTVRRAGSMGEYGCFSFFGKGLVDSRSEY
jgi:dTDP-4-amino-4,6-dideoxygalactose transaminase